MQSFSLYGRFVAVMFPYGFARQFNSTGDVDPWGNRKPEPLITEKCIQSTVNGIIYISPIGIVEMFKLLSRVEIKLTGKEPKDHPMYYYEFTRSNNNVFI